MTKLLIDRAVVEQALHVATGAGYPVALIAALKAALAEPVARPLREGEVMGAYIDFDRNTANKSWSNAEYLIRFGLFVSERTVTPPAPDPALVAALVEPQEPVQEPVAYRFQSPATEKWLLGLEPPVGSRWPIEPLYTAPPQRKPPATIDEMFDRMDKAPRGVFYGHDPMTIWMEAWRAAEQHHGIKEGT